VRIRCNLCERPTDGDAIQLTVIRRDMMKLPISIALLALSLVACEKTTYGNRDNFTTITAREAATMIGSDPALVILDVRTPEEYRSATGHLPRAILIPLDELPKRMAELDPYKRRTLIVYGDSGTRGARAGELLMASGHRPYNIDSGITTWNELKLPVVKEPQAR
jgi:rhodanese-related sulfurtransferase